jgi:SAM-dependent methyltransferase
MTKEILDTASHATYDFRQAACPEDPLKHLFDEWVPYYRLKWAIARVLQPRRILEIGVGFGYSAAAFLDACPDCVYVGIDDGSDTLGSRWARHITRERQAHYASGNSQELAEFPGGHYDLIHIASTVRNLRKALGQARHVLVDGYFSSRDHFLNTTEVVYRYRDLIESCILIPGYAGELLIAPRAVAAPLNQVSGSADLKETYTASYYLQDCGGFDAYKRDKGLSLSDWRLQAVAALAEIAPVGRAVDLGCGRGEVGIHLARMGYQVLAVDYSQSAIELARAARSAAGLPDSQIAFHCGDVNEAPLSGGYDLAVASDLVEHLTPVELERLYSRIAAHLLPHGIFVVHTFPNRWYYQYEYRRRLREARKLGAYLPAEPRSRYEELMHINEQSPRVLKRQLSQCFGNVLVWFADHGMANPVENLKRPFSRNEMRAAGDLFALASHGLVSRECLLAKFEMHPVSQALEGRLEILEMPAVVWAGVRFRARVRLRNDSGVDLRSRGPNPVHLSYHIYLEDGSALVYDGDRTLLPTARPGSVHELEMDIAAPSRPGRFLFRLTLVQEQVRWFDQPPESILADQWIQVH